MRAALTLADKTRVHIWRDGLKALPDATEANNVVIEDEATAQAWVAASYAHDHQLGLLTHVLGETGARPSQAVRLRVRDLIVTDPKAPRLMMPKCGKGGTRHPGQRKVERYAVSISPELAKLLKAAAKGRPSNAALLLRKNGKPWSENDPANDYRRDVRSVVENIGLDPDVYGLYAFRHTLDHADAAHGHPHRNCRQGHDTSEAMIRKHYAASILDYTDEITRKTLPVARACAGACREQRHSSWRSGERAGRSEFTYRRRRLLLRFEFNRVVFLKSFITQARTKSARQHQGVHLVIWLFDLFYLIGQQAFRKLQTISLFKSTP